MEAFSFVTFALLFHNLYDESVAFFQFLGCTEVDQAKGIEIVKSGIQKMRVRAKVFFSDLQTRFNGIYFFIIAVQYQLEKIGRDKDIKGLETP